MHAPRPGHSPEGIVIAIAIPALLLLGGCYLVRPTVGGGEISSKKAARERRIIPSDIALPAGYRIEAAASGLTYPTGVAFDDTGGLHVVESGYSYGEDWEEPRLLRVGKHGILTVLAAGDSNGPWTGLAWHKSMAPPAAGIVPASLEPANGAFYVTEGGALRGGRILRITSGGHKEVVVEGLPSLGDHHSNGTMVGPDGMLYFGQGTATNSGVVGQDNLRMGWLKRQPKYHDRPCGDLVLAGVNYATLNPLTPEKTDSAETGAFSPFGTKTWAGQVVKGEVPCNGAVMRVSPSGGPLQVVAWGFRNPYALAFSPAGRLFVLDNGYDERGSRPVWGAADMLWQVHEGYWYGWPDYSGEKTLDRAEFMPPGGDAPPMLLDRPPGQVPNPTAYLPVHSSASGLDFSHSSSFGFEGQAIVALFGDMAPAAGKILSPVGFKLVRVDVETRAVEDFAMNREGSEGPASRSGTGGLERPIAVRFSPDGKSLYVVDFGVMRVTRKGVFPVPRTGVLWRIWKEASR